MMRKAQVFIIGCLLITFTSLYIYNSYPSYVIPVPLINIHRSTNDSLLRNVELFANSSDGRNAPQFLKIGRTLTKVEKSGVGITELLKVSKLETKTNLAGNTSTLVKDVSRTLDENLSIRGFTRIRNEEPKARNNNKETTFNTRPEALSDITRSIQNINSKSTVGSQLWAKLGTTSSCTPSKQNLAFIKTHKTGSTTLGHLINRFGYHYRLSFVLNKHSRNNGHLVYYNVTKESPRLKFLPPIGVKMRDYQNYKYNLVAIHVRYNRRAMDSFMKPNTNYITIIRDPGSQFESAFSHFQFDDAFPIAERRKFNTTKDKLEHFFEKPILYRDRLKLLSWENSPGLRWYYARNNQAFDLGLDHKYHMNTNMVQKFIDRLEREMDVVLLTEYLDESLVVLRKKMCWTWNDILYIAKNRRPDVEILPELLREKMRSWNAVDTMLYSHFNRTLWRKIEEYGPDFQKDLLLFKDMLAQVFTECVSNQYQQSQGRNFHWVEYKPREGSSSECKLLVESKRTLFRKIWARQDIIRSVLSSDRRRSEILIGHARRMRYGQYYSRTRLNLDASKRVHKVDGPGSNRSIVTQPKNNFDTQYRSQPIHQRAKKIPPHTSTRRIANLQTQRQLRERALVAHKRPI